MITAELAHVSFRRMASAPTLTGQCVAQNIYPADEVAHCVFEHTWHDVIWDLCFTCSETREVFVSWHYNSGLRLFT